MIPPSRVLGSKTPPARRTNTQFCLGVDDPFPKRAWLQRIKDAESWTSFVPVFEKLRRTVPVYMAGLVPGPAASTNAETLHQALRPLLVHSPYHHAHAHCPLSKPSFSCMGCCTGSVTSRRLAEWSAHAALPDRPVCLLIPVLSSPLVPPISTLSS
ncbi:hypothetical protein IMZ48_31810 [Candidatus Bathyarchaeota archaeon]|nr:hypothetical protein [Candidatus Bathyarchaeota archaeon]